jgi:hypothetical protein
MKIYESLTMDQSQRVFRMSADEMYRLYASYADSGTEDGRSMATLLGRYWKKSLNKQKMFEMTRIGLLREASHAHNNQWYELETILRGWAESV